MEVRNKAFADSSYFVALFNDGDAQYLKALEIGRILDIEEQQLVISNFIFIPGLTGLSQVPCLPAGREAFSEDFESRSRTTENKTAAF
ncbi:MAG: hypothetical protein AAB410_04195 [Patescibacteria group bacterium]